MPQVLKRVVPVAVDRAIREIIQPVVERSVTIACITSKELVQKDFAMEADENKMRKVFHVMSALTDRGLLEKLDCLSSLPVMCSVRSVGHWPVSAGPSRFLGNRL